MIEFLVLKIALEFGGHVYIDTAQKCVDEELTTTCTPGLTVIHNESIPRIIQLLRTNPSYAKQLFSANPDAQYLDILNPDHCAMITFTKQQELIFKEIKEYQGHKCLKNRSGNSFMAKFDLKTGIDIETDETLALKELVEKIRRSPYLIDHNIVLEQVNNGAFLLYNIEPEKNIILDKNYWESVSILLMINNNIVTMLIDGAYGTGINPPQSASEFSATSRDYHEETKMFYLKLKNAAYG